MLHGALSDEQSLAPLAVNVNIWGSYKHNHWSSFHFWFSFCYCIVMQGANISSVRNIGNITSFTGVSFMQMSLNGGCVVHLPTTRYWRFTTTPRSPSLLRLRAMEWAGTDIFKPCSRWRRDLCVIYRCPKSVQGRDGAATYKESTVHEPFRQQRGKNTTICDVWGYRNVAIIPKSFAK